MKSLLAVKDKDGNIFTIPSKTPKAILEVHYPTSYYQFIVQEVEVDSDGNAVYPEKDIIVPLPEASSIDLMAVNEDDIGEIVESEVL